MRGRRRFLKVAAAAAAAGAWGAGAQDSRIVSDGAGRKVVLPRRIERIYAAGPPASILVFAVAPDKLIGWTSTWRGAEKPFIAKKYAELPTLGRMTGRGHTEKVEIRSEERRIGEGC